MDEHIKQKLELSNLSLNTFQKILNVDGDNIEKYLKIFEILEIENVDELDTETFLEYVNYFVNNKFEMDQYVKEIEINGYTYSTTFKEDKWILNVKESSLIEKVVTTKKDWLIYAIAIIFKRNDLSKIEHYDQTHIDYKTELFKDIKLKDIYQYYFWLQEKFTKNINGNIK